MTLLSIPKISKREHSLKKITAIIILHQDGKLFMQIDDYLTLPRSTIAKILYHNARQSGQLFQLNMQLNGPNKLNDQDEKTLVCNIKQFLNDHLKALSTFLKSGYTFSQSTVRKYLRSEEFSRFKAQKKPYLSPKPNKNRLS